MLLILAGVSISLVVGDNGVLTRATGSSDATKLAQAKEAFGLAINEVQTEFFNDYAKDASKKSGMYITPAKIAYALEKQGYYLYEGSATSPITGAAAVQANENSKFNSSTLYFISTSKTGQTDVVPVRVAVGTVGANVSFGAFKGDSAAVPATP